MKQRIQKEHQKQVILREKSVQSSTSTNPKEKGRSMVEMLGVLAVIGVLSVGGIMGYKYGMMKYRVNETINELNIMANTYGVQMQQMAEEQTLPTEGELLSEENAVTRMGYGYEVLGFDNHFEIALFNVPNPECEQLQKTGWALPYEIKAETVTAESCGELIYYIDNGLTGTLTEYVDSDEEDDEEQDKSCGLYGHWDGSRCVCDNGYIGNKCQHCDVSKGYRQQDSKGRCYNLDNYDQCTSADFCNGHGYASVDEGICVCHNCQDGYYGTNCELSRDDGLVCNGHGQYETWYNGSYQFYGSGCDCKAGYYGRNCEFTDKSDVCSGKGIMMNYGYCHCIDGFSGVDCEIQEPEKNCGIKFNNYQWSGYPVYINDSVVCQCEYGYYGDNCEKKCDNTCDNGGEPIYQEGKCQCLCNKYGNAYYAENCLNCSTQISCKYNGSTSGSFRYNKTTQSCECDCYSGFFGTNCEKKCSSEILCSNHGYAQYNSETQSCECSCSEGYYGVNCEKDCLSLDCGQNGKGIYNSNTQSCECFCSGDYYGKKCETHYCNNQGEKYLINSDFSDLHCACNNGYYGTHCDKQCSSSCENGVTNPYGECDCLCEKGYTGSDCSIKCDITCQNGGTLYTTGTDCGCNCPTPFYGNVCQYNCANEMTCPEGKTLVAVKDGCGCITR